ncbi:MAG: GNAT family N-acetyltransferase [Anaerolineae bacterium]|nr:GNAT family N-acetyltransferase [Anaerolineae bacterium]
MKQLDIEAVYDAADDVVDVVRKGLADYNAAILGPKEHHRLTLAVRDETGQVLGGLVAALSWDWLHITMLWLHEGARGHGVGTTLLRLAEEKAVEVGITRAHVETTSFQALDFYLKNGYAIFARLPDKPIGHTWYYLRKENLGSGE